MPGSGTLRGMGRFGRLLGMVAGACAVSVACAAAKVDEGPIARALDAAADAVRDVVGLDVAVSDVRADTPPAPVPPTVDDVACDADGTWGGQPAWFARKSYPGKTVAELAMVRGLVCGGAPSGIECQSALTGVASGQVEILCGLKVSDVSKIRGKFITP